MCGMGNHIDSQLDIRRGKLQRRAWVEVDLGRLRGNYCRISESVKPAKVLCVLKANAYQLGSGLYARALYAAGCSQFADNAL